MNSSISSIKTRIKSISSTKKITSAMKSVSTVKLNRMSKFLSKNIEYKNAIYDALDAALKSDYKFNSKLCIDNTALKKLYIIYTSDIGLCGAYNSNIIKYIENNISKNDLLYIVGSSSYMHLKNMGFNIINDLILSDDSNYYTLEKIFDLGIDLFLDNKISSINVIYNKFINTISYKLTVDKLIPLNNKNINKTSEILLEPNPDAIFDNLINLYLKSELYSLLLDAKTSEQSARRFAMENATSNADDLIDELTLEYNQARQASITQEITEIVSGANAI